MFGFHTFLNNVTAVKKTGLNISVRIYILLIDFEAIPPKHKRSEKNNKRTLFKSLKIAALLLCRATVGSL